MTSASHELMQFTYACTLIFPSFMLIHFRTNLRALFLLVKCVLICKMHLVLEYVAFQPRGSMFALHNMELYGVLSGQSSIV